MVKSKILIVTAFILVLALINLSQATMLQGSPSFNLTQFSYAPSQKIEGYVNFSLTTEPADKLLSVNISKAGVVLSTKEMRILDFLRNSSVPFDCSQNCLVSYVASNKQSQKSELIGVGEKYYALAASGRYVPEVINLTFKITGDSGGDPVCGEPPIKMDILNDGSIDFEYAKPSEDQWCSDKLKASDCLSEPTEESDLGETPYCEKIFLEKTGKLEVAASLKLVGGDIGEEKIEFSVYDEQGNEKGRCVSEDYIEGTYKNATCPISSIDPETEEPTGFYIEEAGDYFVCVRLKGSSSAVYSIQKETNPPLCGIYGIPPQDYVADYAIYAREAKFASFNDEWTFDETTYLGGSDSDLFEYVQSYIDSKYSKNCTSARCAIPLRFISESTQNLNLSDILFLYDTDSGETRNNYFYDLQVKPPVINLTRQAIPLTVFNISVPEEQALNYRISVKYASSLLGQSTIFKVEPVPVIQTITPLVVTPGQVATFTVIAIPLEGKPIVNYSWNFNDGSPEQFTSVPRLSHIYSLGVYTLTVKITDSAGKIGSKTVTINASLSKEALNQSYLLKKQLYSNLSSFPVESWYQDLVFNSSQINATLFTVNTQLNSQNPDLNAIKSALDSIKIPISISNSLVIPESSYFPNPTGINLDYLSDLGAGTIIDEESLKNAVGAWENDVSFSLGATIKKITFDDNSNQEITLLSLRAIPQGSEDVFLVLNMPSGISPTQVKIKESIEPYTGFSDALGFNFTSALTLSLAIPARAEISSLNVYASPIFSSLDTENTPNGTDEGGKSIVLPIILAIVILAVLILVIFKIWKKKPSEGNKSSNLFENPADEANLINYVQSSLLQGKSQPETEKELLEQGWNKKQIDYAFKNKDNQDIEPEQAFNY